MGGNPKQTETSGLAICPLSLQCLAREHLDLNNMPASLWGALSQLVDDVDKKKMNTQLRVAMMRRGKAIQGNFGGKWGRIRGVAVCIGW